MPLAPFEPDMDAWSAWRPEQVHARLAGVDAPWYIAAGWAVDLFLGEQMREHEDIEIGMAARDFGKFASALGDCDLFAIESGSAYPIDPPYADAPLPGHQTWVRDRASGLWRLNIFREPGEEGMWVCRRDASIRMPWERLILRNAQGIPFARPEVVLLFKAKAARAKDEADWMRVVPKLDRQARQWLADAMARVHPGHAWAASL